MASMPSSRVATLSSREPRSRFRSNRISSWRPDSDGTGSPQQHLRASSLQAHLALSYFRWPS
eukprot:5340460-Prymnesium_polylepis.1